jgi:drug/metabolite transporter (DMT)-like permease
MPVPLPSALDPAGAPRDDVRRGVAYACIANFVFSFFNVVVKWLSDDYPVAELVFFRSAFALVPIVFLVWRAGGTGTLRTNRPMAHTLRAAIWLTSFCCSFLALHFLPLADAVAFSFAAPLVVKALSVPVLGERVGLHRWSAVLLGFVGVLVMARPTGNVFQLGALFGIGNSLFFALGSLSVRQLSRTESSATIVFYTQLFGAIFSGLAVPFFWVTPRWPDTLAMIATGLGGGIAQYWMTQAYHYAPATVIAPFSYTSIIWAVIFGYLVWSDLPTAAVMIGAVLVMASGLYILHRETRRTHEAAAAKAEPAE